MKTLKINKLSRLHWSLIGLALLGAAMSLTSPTVRGIVQRRATALNASILGQRHAAPGQTATTAASNNTFTVRSYGGKCLEFGVPRTIIEQRMAKNYPVFISDCNGSAAQQVRIEELTDRPGHLVILRAGNGVIGKKLDFVFTRHTASEAQSVNSSTEARDAEQASPAALSATGAVTEVPLETQPYTGSEGQIFALDGDSMILAADRNLVIEAQNNRGANGTPLALGRRDLADAEFWTFTATDGSNRRPTSGFVRVPQEHDHRTLDHQFRSAVERAKLDPGTVIEIEQGVAIDLSDSSVTFIGKGTTIRGDRRGTRLGPKLFWSKFHPDESVLIIEGADVRITGLRLQGPSSSTDGDNPASRAVIAYDYHPRSIIDHNELSSWTFESVYVDGDPNQPIVCQDNGDPRRTRPPNVRVARNFIHHNQRYERGYGVVAHYGGFPLIEGNTFVSNRHAIAADGNACTSYLAYYNLVLSAAPLQERVGGVVSWYTHDFDAHGTDDKGVGGGRGGHAGQYFEIARNTFLGTNRHNFELRGEPSYAVDIGSNISLRSLEDAINCSYCGDINKLRVYTNNQFKAPNPTLRLGVGDFDGDGKDDLFLATGAAWYYSPAGRFEWRFLNAQKEKLDSLLFGDFDGDGRTDVFTQRGYNWDVSWGGASRWETINVSGSILGKAAIGDFDGDRRADVLFADGHQSLVSYGGNTQFTPFALLSQQVSELRFGDFNRDGKTDVFGVVGANWMVVYGGTNYWAPLRAKSTDSMQYLAVADFDGDGQADVATSRYEKVDDSGHYRWMVSRSGVSEFTTLRTAGWAMSNIPKHGGVSAVLPIGRFDNAPGVDVLLWQSPGQSLDIASGGSGASRRHSRQDMR